MSLEEQIAQAVEAAVGRAVEPLRVELARIRQHRAEQDEAPVTMREAARRLGVSLRTVERRVACGDLESVQTGRARRVRLPSRQG